MQTEQNVAQLEGFTKTRIVTYLAPTQLFPKSLYTHLVAHIYELLTEGTTCTVFTASDFPTMIKNNYLIHGPRKFIVRGTGETVNTFREEDERLTFFLKPSFAPPSSHSLQGWRISGQGGELREEITFDLARDSSYCYTLNAHTTTLVHTSNAQVTLATQEQSIQLDAVPFWQFVFGTDDPREEISLAHAAQLLGLSILTLRRRVGEGKLPAIRAASFHPGIPRPGLEEYLGYRQAFPQGCISPRQVARYQTWRTSWRKQYL